MVLDVFIALLLTHSHGRCRTTLSDYGAMRETEGNMTDPTLCEVAASIKEEMKWDFLMLIANFETT